MFRLHAGMFIVCVQCLGKQKRVLEFLKLELQQLSATL